MSGSLKDPGGYLIPYVGPFLIHDDERAIVRVADIKSAEARIQELEEALQDLNVTRLLAEHIAKNCCPPKGLAAIREGRKRTTPLPGITAIREGKRRARILNHFAKRRYGA